MHAQLHSGEQVPPTGKSAGHDARPGRAARASCALAILLAGLTIAGPAPALAVNQTVIASGLTFTDRNVNVAQGDTVTWTNTSGTHNVHFEDGSFDMPAVPTPSPWTVAHTFNQVGTYGYYCELHREVGMSGTVQVDASGGGPAPGPGSPSPLPGPGAILPGGDDQRPVSSLGGPSTQDVDKLYVRASMNEAGTLTATATVDVPATAARVYRFRSVTRSVSANAPVRLRLKLSRKSRRAVKRGLRRKRLRAKVRVLAKDRTGNRTTRKRTIRLTR